MLLTTVTGGYKRGTNLAQIDFQSVLQGVSRLGASVGNWIAIEDKGEVLTSVNLDSSDFNYSIDTLLNDLKGGISY